MVPKLNSSAPRIAAMTMSRPVRRPPSVRSVTRSRRSFSIEYLLGLGEAEFPGQTGVLDRRERRGSGAAVVAGNQDDVGVGLGDAGRDRADAGLGDQFHTDARRAG